ncbi:type III pantothenate kinase [Ferruginivarius sediminum]|uniref:Type III pantothenate kinase n=1 Tax=Ferruginivarius sediminum TaxID=2661937 RepID=A0A369TA36_9PROT|nr:type III pantothenate kinase [Ferruginivarius sediminum]RDD62148.1 type III pantothenate kinase [Ferruginivarius sediminum]
MLLAIDSGNTNVVFAIYDGDTLRGRWRASSDARRTPDEYAVWLTQLMALEGLVPKDIDGCVMANVVPAATYSLKTLCARYFGGPPVTVGEPGVELGVPIRIDRPEQVGADRLVNAVAAHERYSGALVIVDFGTATTFDVIGADGGYEGGIIAPGIYSSMDALHNAAARLPRVAVEKPPQVIGKATVPAMQSGVFWGYIGLIEGILSRIGQEYGHAPTVVATGGLAAMFEAETNAIHNVDPDLTLRGLKRIYEANRKV